MFFILTMGTLLGHIVPGTFFFLFAFWWLISILRKYALLIHVNYFKLYHLDAFFLL